MVKRLEPNLLRGDISVCVQVCHYTLPLRRNSEVKKMSSDSELACEQAHLYREPAKRGKVGKARKSEPACELLIF